MTSPSFNPEWIPKNTSGILEERTSLVAPILSAVAYGMLTTLFFQCMLYARRGRPKAFWIPYFNVVIFTLATVGLGCSIRTLQQAFVDYRDFPGGPNAYVFAFYASPLRLTALVCYVLISWFSDGLMLYRFMVIYGSRKWVTALPAVVYLGFLAMSICFMSTLARGDLFGGNALRNFGIAYWSLSVGLNISITAAIVARLLYMRSRLKADFGSTSAELYTSIAALLIESAALYSTWALAHIILYARSDPMQSIVLSPLGQIQGIASLLIIFRVGQGKAWNQGTLNGTTHEGTGNTMKGMSNSSINGVTMSTKVDTEVSEY